MIKLARIYHKRFTHLNVCHSKISTVEGYKLLSSNYSDDLKIQINELMHEQTGAKVYHFERNDQDNTFATIFKTFPSDSKGTPHILEHLACCGSQKYPIRDPFFNMLKRSVNTYMNAWTGQDFTCYPFSSANPKDWNNLFSVYTDMSFRPLLNELDFMQEGWRYEINQKGEKEIKGIVFNEMKGAYQSSQRQLMIALNEALFSGTGYIYDSGGKPQQIVNLSYQQLLDMYNYFYHPSNMSLFLYGNQNVQSVLKRINDEYLSKYQKSTKYNHNQKFTPSLPKQHFKTLTSKTAETNFVSLYFYIKNIEELNPVESLTFKILQYLMLEKNTSYVYESFIETGIAENIGHSGFNESKLSSFGITLKGIDSEYSPEAYYEAVIKLFEEIFTKGVNEKRLLEFLHELQIGIKTPKQNYGIKLLQDCLNYMNHRLELISFLSPLKYIQQAKENLLNKEKLRQFIEKNFINNKHFVVVKQIQEQTKQSQQKETETQSIQPVQKKIESSIDLPIEEIKSKQEELKKRQSVVQDANVLPKLNLEDLIPRKRLSPDVVQDITVQNRRLRYLHIPIENEIHFYRFVFNFKKPSFQMNDKLSLWNFLLNKGISTKQNNYKELSSKLGEFTAGFYSATSFGPTDSVNIVLGITCLKRNKEQLFNLIEQIIFDPVFEEENVKNLYRAFENEAIETLTDTPIGECLDECGASLNLTSRIFNKYQKIKTGLEIVRSENISVQKEISNYLLQADNVILIEHSNQKESKLPSFFQRFQQHPVVRPNEIDFKPTFCSKAVVHNFDVNFCTQQYLGPNYLSKEHAQMCILTQYLEQQYLHPEIREKGGAYGARSSIRESGNISLYSYMDPEATKTFKVFDQSVQRIKSLSKIPEQKLSQIKITLLGQMQRIKVPQEECVGAILKGYNNKDYEQFLEWIKNAQSDRILELSRKYLDSENKSRCVFGKEVPEGFVEEKLSSFI